MRALHVIAGVAPRYGGPSQAIVGMTRSLREAGIETLIATTDADGPGRLRVALETETLYEGVPAIFFRRQWSESLKISFPLARWLRAHIAAFDVVHIHAVFSHGSMAAASACHARRVPYVVRPLGNLDPWSMRQKPIRKRLFWHMGVRAMLNRAAAIHYTTAEEQRLAESSLGLSRGVVVALGVDEQVFATARDEMRFRREHPDLGAAPYVIVLSRLHPKKGLERLVDSFLHVTARPELSTWRLVLAGDGEAEYVWHLQQYARVQVGNERVVFTGWLAGLDKFSALDSASLMALPSSQENFGIAVVEALARGVPVLVSPHVNLAPDIVAANAGWVAALEAEHLETVLETALMQADERSRRGEAGRKLARERFTWERSAADLSRLYASIREEVGQSTVAPALG